MYSKIIGTGGYLPNKILTNKDLESLVDTTDEWIVERTGIKQRHISEDNETSSSMATKASLDAIKRVELDLRSGDEVVENLSGGERQGVVIARALYFRTKVLIMDEPTNHLSVKETEKVLRWIEKLKAEGTTCIFITHNLHHVYPVSDRLVVFARGEKIADVQKKDTSIEDLTKMIVHD